MRGGDGGRRRERRARAGAGGRGHRHERRHGRGRGGGTHRAPAARLVAGARGVPDRAADDARGERQHWLHAVVQRLRADDGRARIPSAHFRRGITVPARCGDFVEFVEVVEGEVRGRK